MANMIEPIFGENELFSYLQWLRLLKDSEINSLKIEENTAKSGISFSNFKKRFASAVGGYTNKSKKIEQNIEKYKSSGHYFINEDGARQAMGTIFASDTNGVARLIFACKVALDSEFDYVYENNGLQEASKFLFNEEDKLIKIKIEFESIYREISKKPLSSLQKTILGTVIAASIISVVVIPAIGLSGAALKTAGAASALKTAGFAGLASSAGAISVSSLVFASAIVGSTYLSMKAYNREEIRKSFKNISIEEHDMFLSLQCLIIKHLRLDLSREAFKEELDKILQNINHLKGDLDYFLFVESTDKITNKEKLESFHRFDTSLLKRMF